MGAEVTDAMVEAASAVIYSECCPPYMPRVNDYTDAQIAAGELKKADRWANQMNDDLIRRALSAALTAKASG